MVKQRKEQTKDWLNDDNEKIRNFARDYHLSLDKTIAEETQRATENLELIKYQYGVSSK